MDREAAARAVDAVHLCVGLVIAAGPLVTPYSHYGTLMVFYVMLLYDWIDDNECMLDLLTAWILRSDTPTGLFFKRYTPFVDDGLLRSTVTTLVAMNLMVVIVHFSRAAGIPLFPTSGSKFLIGMVALVFTLVKLAQIQDQGKNAWLLSALAVEKNRPPPVFPIEFGASPEYVGPHSEP